MPNLHFLTNLCFLICTCSSFQPIIINQNYSQSYTYEVNKTLGYILDFSAIEQKLPPRITIESHNASKATPLMIVAQQKQELLSWKLPLIVESEQGAVVFNRTSRTLCQNMFKGYYATKQKTTHNPVVTVTTASSKNVSFTIMVDYQDKFILELLTPVNLTISPSEPWYLFYNFSNNGNATSETVILEVESQQTVCMTVSIQNVSCPVFDMNTDITYRGFYETVNRKGGITIPKTKFPFGFYVVFVAHPDDSECDLNSAATPTGPRTKHITVTVKRTVSYDDYLTAVVSTLSAIGGFYVVFILAFFFCSRSTYRPRQMEYVTAETPTNSNTVPIDPDMISVDDENEFDTLDETRTDKKILLGKSVLYLNDLARKDPRIHQYKSYLYLYQVLTVALFYGLPVIQLVITYQRMLNDTGEQDLCYYNFLCAHPYGFISDFNHVFSNIGYILFGVLFLWIVYRREITHKDLDFERLYGIPQHYGMFYAMGVALIMEGVLSGSYHICPNQSNFQFDSSFMYVMTVLCMVKLYQNRHPDINATAYSTFGVLAIAILLAMIGLLQGTLSFWIFFTVLYILACFYFSIQIYYMGIWGINRSTFYRVYQICRHDFWSGPLNVLRPCHKARMCLLIIGNACNWALAFWGLYRHEKDFAFFLLAIFMANTSLYFCFYVFMKCLNKERVNRLSILFLVISLTCASSAMYFFLHKSISWSNTPAESRWFNQECKILNFYDYHDVWHFLSATGMFFMFMVLLTLDDDLSHTHRSQIIVF